MDASGLMERSAASAAKTVTRRVLGAIGEPMTAVSYVRFLQPFGQLARRGFELCTLGSSLRLTRDGDAYRLDGARLADADLLIFPQCVASPTMPDGGRVEVIESLLDEAARRGVPVIYSVDDYLPEIEPANPAYEKIACSRAGVCRILEACAAIFVTTAALERAMARFGKPVFRLPNAVDPDRLRPRPRRERALTLGWSGSSSHLDDLSMLLPALKRLRRRCAFDFKLYGLVDRPIPRQLAEIRRHRRSYSAAQRETADRFVALARELRELPHRHYPFEPMEAFFERLRALDLDVGLCPLLDTPFNRHKSALKAHEYAAVDTLAVASDVEPYRGEVSVLVPNSTEAWIDSLEPWLRDGRRRERELEKQRAHVMERRSVDRLADRWQNALETILRGHPDEP